VAEVEGPGLVVFPTSGRRWDRGLLDRAAVAGYAPAWPAVCTAHHALDVWRYHRNVLVRIV